MATIKVTNHLDALARDTRTVATTTRTRMGGVVARNVEQGRELARHLAQEASGPHGTKYYKRISSEMTGPLTGEWGPHAGGTPVGAGYRHNGPNEDMPRSADIQGPAFADDVDSEVAEIFWPGA